MNASLSLLLLLVLLAWRPAHAQVTMVEAELILPTYETKSPDKIPLFYRNEEVQLAERHIYPYPFYDVQSAAKTNKAYKAIILENEYLRFCVTPQMGGRLYYALDKTDGYDLVYNNRVVKPALIGTLGAWTSGGVEWNTPHHHRATSLLDVDCTLQHSPDGSKTVWVGEYEKRSQTRWLVGLTLRPGKAYVKVDFKSLNVTPFHHPALFFANAAVHVNDNYQFVFPPDVEMVNFHYVTEFCRWPIPNQIYQSVDYTRGENLSWWNAAKQPVSFFVTETSQDFIGGIDHGKNAGVVLVGDHRIFKGKKLWNWGKNEVQRVWDQKLTDEDGPYAELMMGFYSDNQPDYNYLAPFETKYGTLYLYGTKGLSGIKEATRDFAVNLEPDQGKALLEVNATSAHKNLRVVLTRGDRVIWEQTIDISPTAPYRCAPAIGAETAIGDLRLAVRASDGSELIAWQRQPPRNAPFPKPYQAPLDPKEYKSSQELYLAGLKIEQFGNPYFDYMKYYQAALDLDPDDVLANTQIGTVYLKRGDYRKAEQHLKAAVRVVTANHTKAKDATALYYLGVCCLKQARIDEALEMLYRSTWSYAYTSAGYTLVAQLEAAQGNCEKALDAAERACQANTQNVEALTAKAILLRKRGASADARTAAQQALAVDPLCFVAMNELRLLHSEEQPHGTNPSPLESLVSHLRAEPYNYIETAARYSQMGLFADASDVLKIAATSGLDPLTSHPMIHYHRGMYLALAGQEDAARQAVDKARTLSTDLCFPYGDESVKVLQHAVSRTPGDATACYLLGNALADYRHEEAVQYWERAAAIDPHKSIVYRNIAYVQANHFQDMPAALANILKAIYLEPAEPRYFTEANLYMAYASLTPQQLSEFVARHRAMSAHVPDMQLLEVKLHIYNGEYDKALGILKQMNYHIKEGATFNPHVHWFDAHLQTGIRHMRSKQHAEAEISFLKAMEFPANLEAERNSKIGIAYYYLGVNSKNAGQPEKAATYFGKMADYTPSQGWGAGDFPELSYFKALASLEMGRDKAEAEQRFRDLVADGEKRLVSGQDSRHLTVSISESHSARTFLLEQELGRKSLKVSAYYLQGLGHLGLGDKDKARLCFAKAVEVDPLSMDPKLMLESIP